MTATTIVPVALCGLALLDGAFAGFRASAGHDARLPDRAGIRRSSVWGVSAAAVALAVIGLATLPALLPEATRSARYDVLVDAGAWMVLAYVPMAVVTVLAALVHVAVEAPDIRAATMTLVLGPVTLVRPFVIAFGAGVAIGVGGSIVVLPALVATAVTTLTGPAIRLARFGRPLV